jgi:hypothetical protein
MTQRPADNRTDTRRGAFGDARGYRLRLVIAAVTGGIGFSLTLLAAGGSTQRNSLPVAPAQQDPLVQPLALGALTSVLLALVALGLFAEMGHWAARREGAIRSGVRAAAGAGIAFGWGAALPSIGAVALHGGFASPPTLDGPMLPLLVILLVFQDLLVAGLLFGSLGALVGSVGAIIGRSQNRRQASAEDGVGSMD